MESNKDLDLLEGLDILPTLWSFDPKDWPPIVPLINLDKWYYDSSQSTAVELEMSIDAQSFGLDPSIVTSDEIDGENEMSDESDLRTYFDEHPGIKRAPTSLNIFRRARKAILVTQGFSSSQIAFKLKSEWESATPRLKRKYRSLYERGVKMFKIIITQKSLNLK